MPLKLRRVAVVASQSHKLKVPGSNPGARNKCVSNGKDIDERSSRERISNLWIGRWTSNEASLKLLVEWFDSIGTRNA